MARTSTSWRLLPARELGCGSPATCWRRLTEWATAGVFDQLHLLVLDRLVCDAGGIALTVVVTAANVTDTTMFQAVIDDLPAVRTPAGWQRSRPGKIHADKGYDSRGNRAYLRRRGIRSRIARRGIESSTRLGRYRWRVERRCHG
jgi:IS5 family transposase